MRVYAPSDTSYSVRDASSEKTNQFYFHAACPNSTGPLYRRLARLLLFSSRVPIIIHGLFFFSVSLSVGVLYDLEEACVCAARISEIIIDRFVRCGKEKLRIASVKLYIFLSTSILTTTVIT